ncbi:HCL307Wp [Eremothecium sinecaudum]|uniref:HCL307Wp n=1 Tax=Eremothecium sinecaudum TaxID=45286 RepID=A0A120K1X3_9SACH|nr:HCL307Wp [Eremothecium sinecaudum]AMD19844.1 HCL307Wp [Eremothecium sinecaudum]
MAHITQPFRLASLPKISSLNNYATQPSYLQVANTLTPSANTITIGISASSISQYTINPTPKLIYNLPIPSTNVATACTVAELNDGEELWCFALLANNKVSTLNVLKKQAPTTDASILNAAADTEKEPLKLVMDDKVVNIKVLSSPQRIIVILESGLIQTYDYELKLLHSLDISYKNVRFVEYFKSTLDNEDYMLVLCDLEDKKACYKIFKMPNASTNTPISELNSIILEEFSVQESKIIYQFGKIYRLSGNKVYVYNLPHLQLSHSVELPFVNIEDLTSLQPVSTNRVLFTNGNKIMLLDLLHNALLYERELTNVKTFQVLRTAVIRGNLEDNNTTIAVGVATKHGPNPISSLEIVTVDVGTGSLKDSLGKGFLVEDNANLQTLQPLLNEDYDEETTHETPDFDAIIEELKTKSSSTKSFDQIFKKRLNLKNDYYTESDRHINNPNFISSVLEIIFSSYKKDYPETLTYLLTHPLFPASRTVDLLSRLKSNPRLFKQAIVTCPNLPLKELLQELFTVLNEELSVDLSLRILQDFTKEEVKRGIKQMSKVDMNTFIDFMTNETQDFEDRNKSKAQLFLLLSLVIESVGLFGLEPEQLNKLATYIDSQVAWVDQTIELLHILEINCSNTRKWKSKGASSKSGHEDDQEKAIPLYSLEYLGN